MEIDPKQVKETTTRISIKKKYEIEVKEKEKQIEKLECEIEQIKATIQNEKQTNDRSAQLSDRFACLMSMQVLAGIMSKTIGNGDLSGLNDRLYKEEELFEYKAKMLELLKRL